MIRLNENNFIVEEIGLDGTIYKINEKVKKEGEGPYTHFIMQKKRWTTIDAIRVISKKTRIPYKKFGFAGNKDRNAITTQLVSVKAELPEVNIKDIEILGKWKAKDRIRLGDLFGNRFTIKEDIWLEDNKIINLFGKQRFGSVRKNTHKIGYLIIKKRFEEAVIDFLTNSEGENNKENIEARKRLKEELDFEKAKEYFPKSLRYERILLEHLSKNNRDYIGALRKLPRTLLLLFIHSFQSYLFNISAIEQIKENYFERYCGTTNRIPDINKQGTDWPVGNIIGYKSELNKIEKELLDEIGLNKYEFKINGIPEISSKGSLRTIEIPILDKQKDPFRFSLPKGSYATIVIDKINGMDFEKEYNKELIKNINKW